MCILVQPVASVGELLAPPTDEALATLLAWKERSLQLHDGVPALSAEESEARRRGLNVVTQVIKSIEVQHGVRLPDAFLEVVRLADLLAQTEGPSASAPGALSRCLAALDVVLQLRQADFRVAEFVCDDVEGESILSQSAALQARLHEALAEPQSLPNLAAWLDALWDRFGTVTGQSLAEFVPKLREVSYHIATYSMWLTAAHQNRAPHQIVLGSFALSLLCSGICAAEVLKPALLELRQWKRILLAIFHANMDVEYQAACLAPPNSMLIMILCTGSTVSELQECIEHSVIEFVDVSGCSNSSDLKPEGQTGDRSEASVVVSDPKTPELCEDVKTGRIRSGIVKLLCAKYSFVEFVVWRVFRQCKRKHFDPI